MIVTTATTPCMTINGLLYIRGQEQDYNVWRQLGNKGWGWKDVLPYFTKLAVIGIC